VFRQPQGDDYLQQHLYAAGRVARPLAFPEIAVEVAALFP
jgi:Uma2 family endonuclease